MQRMPNTVHVLSARVRTDGGSFRLVGEVYNNTSRWVGPVTVTARLYDVNHRLLTTRSVKTILSYIPAYGRVPFSIDGPPVPGYRGVSFSISARATSKALGTPTITSTTSTVNSAGQRLVNGTVKNPYSRTTTSFGVGCHALRRAGQRPGREAIRPRREQPRARQVDDVPDHVRRRSA